MLLKERLVHDQPSQYWVFLGNIREQREFFFSYCYQGSFSLPYNQRSVECILRAAQKMKELNEEVKQKGEAVESARSVKRASLGID